ncbi:hypothetical protein H2201_006099 [Coniosporium apollinis]|uniref:Cyclopropane-fatty-acyl-phospholipid synthase n=1 Tax=Coniosporium apollinis TaxID=61459 RepID=A0ABQ9NQA2_9PEZI|nr:hypothetical protein H2201_006099 [Coniosporium apollinis]
MLLSNTIVFRFNALRSYAGSLAWDPLVKLSRSLTLALLQRIQTGQLTITDTDGQIYHCGIALPSTPCTTLHVYKNLFWVRLLLFADMGFAESYTLFEISCRDLTAFFKLFILNRSHLFNGSTLTSTLSTSLTGLLRRANDLSNARLNIAAHYDISNAMFAAFLSADMTYLRPIWRATSDPRSSSEPLEASQMRKLSRFIRAARIKPGDHKEPAEERIGSAGLENGIEVLLWDYRALEKMGKVPVGGFDKLVSIEMLEAVEREYLVTYFECVDRLLKREGGVAVFQCITMTEARYEAYAKGDGFICKHILPGGHLPSVSQLVQKIAEGSRATLVVDAIKDIGPHYAKTLRLWEGNFMQNFDAEIRPALLVEHEHMTKRDAETFRRKWEYYFTYCEAGFATKTLGDVIITAGREGAMEMLEDVSF